MKLVTVLLQNAFLKKGTVSWIRRVLGHECVTAITQGKDSSDFCYLRMLSESDSKQNYEGKKCKMLLQLA